MLNIFNIYFLFSSLCLVFVPSAWTMCVLCFDISEWYVIWKHPLKEHYPLAEPRKIALPKQNSENIQFSTLVPSDRP